MVDRRRSTGLRPTADHAGRRPGVVDVILVEPDRARSCHRRGPYRRLCRPRDCADLVTGLPAGKRIRCPYVGTISKLHPDVVGPVFVRNSARKDRASRPCRWLGAR